MNQRSNRRLRYFSEQKHVNNKDGWEARNNEMKQDQNEKTEITGTSNARMYMTTAAASVNVPTVTRRDIPTSLFPGERGYVRRGLGDVSRKGCYFLPPQGSSSQSCMTSCMEKCAAREAGDAVSVQALLIAETRVFAGVAAVLLRRC